MFRLIVSLSILVLAAGCAAPDLSLALPEVEVGVPVYTTRALIGAQNRFVDIDLGGGASGSASGGTETGGGRGWTAETGVAPRLHLGAVWSTPRGPGQALIVRADLRSAETRVRFPQGIDIFTDSAEAHLIGHETSVEMGIRQEMGRAGAWSGYAGIGLSAAAVRSHVNSALLDVRDRAVIVQPYLSLGLSRRLTPDLSLETLLRSDGRSVPDVSAGMSVRF